MVGAFRGPAGRGGRALLRFRWPEPDQRSVSQLARRPASRAGPRGLDAPLYWGNRNWTPTWTDVAAADRGRRAPPGRGSHDQRVPVVLLVPAVPGEPVRRGPADTSVQVDKIRHYAHHPGFVAASVTPRWTPWTSSAASRRRARLVFVTHAIPTAMAASSGPPPRSAEGGYVDWHRVVAAEVTRQVADTARRRPGGIWSTARGPGRRASPGPNPTSTIISRPARPEGCPPSCWCRSASSPTTWRSSTTWTPRRRPPRRELDLPFARAATAGIDPAFVRRSGRPDRRAGRGSPGPGGRRADAEPAGVPVIRGGRAGRYLCLPVLLPESAGTGPSGPVPAPPRI